MSIEHEPHLAADVAITTERSRQPRLPLQRTLDLVEHADTIRARAF